MIVGPTWENNRGEMMEGNKEMNRRECTAKKSLAVEFKQALTLVFSYITQFTSFLMKL